MPSDQLVYLETPDSWGHVPKICHPSVRTRTRTCATCGGTLVLTNILRTVLTGSFDGQLGTVSTVNHWVQCAWSGLVSAVIYTSCRDVNRGSAEHSTCDQHAA